MAAEVTVPVTESEYVPAGVPGVGTTLVTLLVTPPQAAQNTSIIKLRPSSHPACRLRVASAARAESASRHHNQISRPNPEASGGRVIPAGGVIDPAVVETDTVTEVGVDPLSVTELGETVHVERAGAPLQVRLTVSLSPP